MKNITIIVLAAIALVSCGDNIPAQDAGTDGGAGGPMGLASGPPGITKAISALCSSTTYPMRQLRKVLLFPLVQYPAKFKTYSASGDTFLTDTLTQSASLTVDGDGSTTCPYLLHWRSTASDPTWTCDITLQSNPAGDKWGPVAPSSCNRGSDPITVNYTVLSNMDSAGNWRYMSGFIKAGVVPGGIQESITLQQDNVKKQPQFVASYYFLDIQYGPL